MFIWEVSGGPNSAAATAPNYYGQFIDAARQGGMPAVAETEYFSQRVVDNPANRDVLLSMDPAEFIAVMSRWQDTYSRPNPVSDLTEEQLKSIQCPVVMFEGNTPDEVHHRSAAEAAHRLIPNSELRPVGLDPRGMGHCGPARPHLPGHRRHQPLPHEGHLLRRPIARVHCQS